MTMTGNDEDLNSADENFDASDEGGTNNETDAPVEKPEPETVKGGKDGNAPAEEPAEDKPASRRANIAAGRDEDEPEEPTKPLWPEDWRHQIATRTAAGDKKAYYRELKRLERIADPAGLYGMYREVEGRLTSGGLIKVPGKDASEEEIAKYHKALGVPEKAEDYLSAIKLANGAEIGDDDKATIGELAAIAKKNGTPPGQINDFVNWYFAKQEEQAAALDDSDDEFRRVSMEKLKEEYGAAFNRKTAGIKALFATAPGGTDADNANSLFSRLLGGRTADGQIIGNDPQMVRFLVDLAHEINPATLVLDDTTNAGKTIETELADIQNLRKTNKRKYYSAEVQKREQDLLSAQLRLQERG